MIHIIQSYNFSYNPKRNPQAGDRSVCIVSPPFCCGCDSRLVINKFTYSRIIPNEIRKKEIEPWASVCPRVVVFVVAIVIQE